MTKKDINEDVEAAFNYAFNLHQAGEWVEAEKFYQELLTHKPNWPDVQHLLGILLGQQGRYQEALPYIVAALKQQPKSATFHNSIGNVYRHLGQIDLAIHHYQTALKFQPDSASVNNNLGILYQKQNQLGKAEKFYQTALALKPNYADAHFNLSTLLTQQEKFSPAIEHLKAALQHQPQHLQAHTHLGQLLLQQGQADAAIVHYQQRLQADPEHAESHHQLAIAYTQCNEFAKAVTEYEETLRLQPTHVEALHNLGSLHLVQRQPDLALQCFLRLLSLQPDRDTYYNLGVIYSYQDRHDDAIHFLNEALRVEPDFYNAQVNLGAVYLKKEDLAQAAHHYQAALALRPNDPELLYILAALTRDTAPITAPKEYVSHLFDEYAPHFEKHLLDYLQYRVPELLLKAVTDYTGVNQAQWDILDLGCGTGLCGLPFRRLAKQLIGVDLSEKMLESAKQKQIYDELLQIDINDALKLQRDLDLIVAGDVFGYVGDLTETFVLAKQALKKQGLLVFTVEKTYDQAFILQSNARFAHSKNYIESLAQENGLTVLACENAVLRTQKQLAVEGYLFLLKK